MNKEVKDLILENRFTYHKPIGNQPKRYVQIRSAGFEFVKVIDKCCPESREKSLAVTKIEEAIMWANASIARNEKE